jgi:hypothetical protein
MAGAAVSAVFQWPFIAALQKTDAIPAVLALTAGALVPPWLAAGAVARRASGDAGSAEEDVCRRDWGVLRALRAAGWVWLALAALRILLTGQRALAGPEPVFWLCLTTSLPPYAAALWLKALRRPSPTIARFPAARLDRGRRQSYC